MLVRHLLTWIRNKDLKVEVLGEFNDAALMKAFGVSHNAIFVAPSLLRQIYLKERMSLNLVD